MRIVRSIKFRSKFLFQRLRNALHEGRQRLNFRKTGTKYGEVISGVVALIGPIKGKNILEIGSDSKGTLLHSLVEQGASEVYGINPALPETKDLGKLHLVKGDAGLLPFDDSSMDLVISISVLEHVSNLESVLSESLRVLTSGGYFYAEFGPIWSAVNGHHLWFYHGGSVVDWRTHELPAYGHLLMTQNEMLQWCKDRFQDENLARKITEFVYQSPDQNRLFFSDYEECFKNSGFDILMFTGCPDLPPADYMDETPISVYLDRLKVLYPQKGGFGYHVARVLLKKR